MTDRRRQTQQKDDDQRNLDITELQLAIIELEIAAKHEEEEIGLC